MPYRPLPSVHIADHHGDLIVLDAARDSYFCLPAAGGGDDDRYDALVAEGLVVAADTADAEPVGERATRDLYGLIGDDTPPLRARDFLALLRAAAFSAWQLRAEKPRDWITRGAEPVAASAVHEDRVIAAAARFRRLSPLVPYMHRCLPNTLMMLAFLRYSGIAARCVFAARTHPFEAHCWAQWADIVLNDSLTHSRWFVAFD